MKTQKSILAIMIILCLFAQFNSFCFAQEDTTMQASAIVGAAIGLFDIITAPLSAKDYNQKLSTFGLKFSKDGLAGHPNRKSIYASKQSVRVDQKSPAKALLISLFATGLPVWVGLTGLDSGNRENLSLILITVGGTLGPSTGHFYAKKYRRGFITAGLRLILWSLFIKKVSDIESS